MQQAVVGSILFTLGSVTAIWLLLTSRGFFASVVLSGVFSTTLVTLNWMPGGRQ